MKTLRNLTYVIAVAAIVAFCAPSAKAINFGFTTNYDVLNITATITTNAETTPKSDDYVWTDHTVALDNKAILSLLEGPDWYNGTFPTGSKLVVSWDAAHNVSSGATGDILVVDKTGTNVLYDASEKSWSSFGNASLTIKFYNQIGAYKANYNQNSPGSLEVAFIDSTTFEINDGENPHNLFINTIGPCTDIFAQGWKNFTSVDFTSWSDSQRADTFGTGTNVFLNGSDNGVNVTVKISASGHGKGVGGYYYAFLP